MKCGAKGCSLDLKEINQTFDDGERRWVLCPNHAMLWAMGEVQFTPVEGSLQSRTFTCELCDAKALVFGDGQHTFHLCPEHLRDILLLRLHPEHWRVLHAQHPDAFLLHDDFYMANGTALQPVIERPRPEADTVPGQAD